MPTVKYLQRRNPPIGRTTLGRYFLFARRVVGGAKNGDAAKWEPANEMVTATINFAIATGRLKDKREGRGESNDEQSESE